MQGAKTIYQLKPAFQTLLRPASDALWRAGITANQVTASAIVLSVLTGAALAWFSPRPGVLLLLGPVLFLRMALNAIDGMIAKEHGMQSRSGAMLNELGDVISDAALYLPLARGFGFSPGMLTGVVVLAIISEMAGALGAIVGSSRRYDGPMGKSDRAFLFGATGLMLGLGMPEGRWQDWVLAFILVLAAVTIWNRARLALREGVGNSACR